MADITREWQGPRHGGLVCIAGVALQMALLLEFETICMNTTPEKGTCYASWKRGREQEDVHSMVSYIFCWSAEGDRAEGDRAE